MEVQPAKLALKATPDPSAKSLNVQSATARMAVPLLTLAHIAIQDGREMTALRCLAQSQGVKAVLLLMCVQLVRLDTQDSSVT